MRRRIVFDFSKAPDAFKKVVAQHTDPSLPYPNNASNGNQYIFLLGSTSLSVSSYQFVLTVFGLLDVFGRFCRDVPDFGLAIYKAEMLFMGTSGKFAVNMQSRVVSLPGALRSFEQHKRKNGIYNEIRLPSLEARQAVSAAAVMLLVPKYMTRATKFTNILSAHNTILGAVDGSLEISSGHGEATEMLQRARDYFVDGVFDQELAECEHFAEFLLSRVFGGELDPRSWRRVEAMSIGPEHVSKLNSSATKTFSLKQLASLGLTRGLFRSVERVFKAIPGAVGLAVFDAPWFVTHANFSTFVGDQPLKVVHCGNEFASCIVVTTPEALALWRKRVLIASGKLNPDVESTHDVVGAFWGDATTRFWLLKRLWWQSTQKTVAPFGFAEPESMHYAAFYCLMPVLARLGGKALAAALSVETPRDLDQVVAEQLMLTIKGDPEALEAHFAALFDLRFGGVVDDPSAMYALAMDARVDLDWRVELVEFLTDSMAWPSDAKFAPDFAPNDWPSSDQYAHVSDDVAKAAISVVRCLNDGLMVHMDERDWFCNPANYDATQDFVHMTNPLILDVAYAYESMPAIDTVIVPAEEVPRDTSNLVRSRLEDLVVEFAIGKEAAELLSPTQRIQYYNEKWVCAPLLTPRTPSRPAGALSQQI